MKHSIIRNTLIYFFNIGFVRVLSIITIPIFTAYLSPWDYGMIALNAIVTGIGATLCGWGLDHFANRLEIKYFNDADRRARCLGWIFLANITLAFIVCSLLSFLPHVFYRYLYQGSELPHFYLYLIPVWTVFTQTIVTFYQHYQINLQQASSYARLNMALQLSNFVILVPGFLFFHFSLTGYMVTMFIVQLFYAGLVLFFWIPRILKLDVRYRRYVPLGFRYGLPLHFQGYVSAIQDYLDRFLIAGKLSVSALGIYSFSFSFSNNYLLATQALHYSLNPELYRKLDQNARCDDQTASYFRRICMFYFMAIAFIGFGFALFAREIIMILANARFHESFRIVPLIIGSFIILDMNSVYNATRVFVKNKTRFQALISYASAFVKAAMLFILIPMIGVWGAVIALFMFHLFTFVIYKLYSDKILPMDTPTTISFLVLLGYGFLYCAAEYLSPLEGFLPVVILKCVLLIITATATIVFLKKSDAVLYGRIVSAITGMIPKPLRPEA